MPNIAHVFPVTHEINADPCLTADAEVSAVAAWVKNPDDMFAEVEALVWSVAVPR